MSEITNLSPRLVWQYFDEITRVPRPSKKEGKIRAFLIDFAKKHHLDYRQDAAGNIVILKPATPGCEKSPVVILQSHMEMVCEKNSDVTFDFDNDPIRTRIDGEWVRAEGTTLGADCGIGMAAAMAMLTADKVEHGPIEALFTVDEETGLTGAFGLGEGMLTGKYLINLDSEDEGEIFIGCAGGIDTLATILYTPEPAPAGLVWFRIALSGLKGGHSGDDIDKGRGNSNKLLNRFLRYGTREFGLRLAQFDGGNLRNAIPREAFAIFGVSAGCVKPMLERFETYKAEITAEFQMTESSLEVTLAEEPAPAQVVDEVTQRRLVNAVCGVPNGVLAMSSAMPGLVETSTNLASVKFPEPGRIVVTTSQRSSVGSARDEAAASVRAVFDLAGARVIHSDGYPGWNPNPGSRLLKVAEQTYERLFGHAPKVRAIHAGLECGLFLEKYPHLEMVSFGPTLRGVHSPDERLEIPTVDKFWKLLVGVVDALR